MAENVVLPPRYASVEVQLKRNPKLKMSDLQILKDWMDKQPHLPNVEIIFLALFLHSKNYNIEGAKQKIENFYTSRTHLPELFYNRNSITKEPEKAFNVVAMVPLEQQTKQGCVITFVKILDANPSVFNFIESIKYLFVTGEVQNVINGISNGQVIILDSSGFSLGHVARINLMLLKKTLFFVRKAAPVRLRAIHILNTVPAMETLMNMMKPFLKIELIKNIHFHTSLETVKEFLPIEALPNESGGKAGPIKEITAKHLKLLHEFHNWLEFAERNHRVNESLRVGKSQFLEDLFGVDGSFRKLDID